MAVEVSETICPYAPESTRFVTSSGVKTDLCLSVGIPTERDSGKITKVGFGEESYACINGHGVVVRNRMREVPHPVRVVYAKARALLQHLEPNGHRHAVGDATWQVLDDFGIVYSFNKPDTFAKKDETLRAYYKLRGNRISSDTGIGVIESDLGAIRLYHTSLMLGRVNPELDMGRLEQVVMANTDVSGGLKAIDMIRYEVIVPDELAHFCIREISPQGAPFLGGQMMRYEAAIHELSKGSANNPWLMRLAHGIFPK